MIVCHNALQTSLVHSRTYFLSCDSGDIISLNGPGLHMVILNSVQSAKDLFERRSKIYSGRPRLEMLEMYVCMTLEPLIQLTMTTMKQDGLGLWRSIPDVLRLMAHP